MIVELIIIICVVCVIALTANKFGIGNVKPKYDIISLKESMDLCSLPVVTFMNNGKKFNFVFDTGSNQNHVSSNAAAEMITNDSGRTTSVQGFNGDAEENHGKLAYFTYKDKEYPIELFVSSALDTSFADIKKNMGVTLHGIIGSDFFREYGYVLDFNDLIAYSKK